MSAVDPHEIDKFKFSHSLRVRWSEIDMQGVVFNGHFLTYYDVAMTEYLRMIDFPYPAGLTEVGMDLHLRKSTLEWLAPVVYDAEIEILTRVSRIGRSSLVFQFLIRLAGGGASAPNPPLAIGENVYVNVLVATRTPELPPEAFTRAIRNFEGCGLA